MLNSYKDLIVWQKSVEFVVEVYSLTDKFPKSEIYGLTSQMRRAAISIHSNITEGYRRQGLGEYQQFLFIANASASELETQIIIAKRIYKHLDYSKVDSLLLEVIKMLNTLIFKIKGKRRK